MLNVQRLVSKSTNKLESPEIGNVFNKNDVVMLVETWDIDMERRKDGFSVWMPMVLEKNKVLSNITVFTEKLPCIQHFMIMESVFHSDCYRDLILGRNSIFYKEIYRN